MDDCTRKHIDTEVFAGISPSVFQAVLDVIPALGFVLNWEPLACAFLADVLRQVSLLGNPLSIGHLKFAHILWGSDVGDFAARRRMTRCVSTLMRCQAMSGCVAVWIDRGGREEKEGKVEYFKTTYSLRDFFVIFGEIQSLAKEQDLMALPKSERKITQLAIVQSVCDARQYQRIPARARQQRYFESEKPKPEPLPKVEVTSLPSMMSYTKAEDWYLEQLKAHLISIGKVDNGFNAVIEGVRRKIRVVEKEVLDAIRRPNGKGASK